MPDFDDLDYGAMRLLRLRVVLISFLKRWGIGLAMVFMLFAAGSSAPLTIAAGLAGTLVLPLADAAAHGWWIVPTSVGYAVAGVVPVAASRSLWWPASWRMAERALPLDPATLRRSDRRIAAIILAPLQGLLMFGLAGMTATERGKPLFFLVVAAWLCSALASLQMSVAWMSAIRTRPTGRRLHRHAPRPMASAAPCALRPLGARMAVIVLPLLRGPARRSAFVLGGGLVVTSGSATASAWSGLPLAWALALHALCALAITSVGSDATRRELQPLWRMNLALPLRHAACERWRNGVVLLPTIVGVVASDITAFAVAAVRVVPLAAYVASVVCGCIVEAVLPRTAETHVRASRWLLTLAICIACASEVT